MPEASDFVTGQKQTPSLWKFRLYWQGFGCLRPFARPNFAEYGGFTIHLGIFGLIVLAAKDRHG